MAKEDFKKFRQVLKQWQGGGGEYYPETFPRHHSNPTKYIIFIVFLWFMMKLRKNLLFLP
jgi:hypothetical protein